MIKKYSNRKLYDTTSRQYITLERIGELIRGGETVQVIDRTSGEDLTAVTLSQVVLERERKRHGAVPEQLLQQLVRGPSEAVTQAVQKSIAAGQDFLQRAEERVVRAPEAALDEALLRTLRSLKIPTQREMSGFDRRLRELSQRVDQLAAAIGQQPVPSAAKPARSGKAANSRPPSRRTPPTPKGA
ncbi:MAG TPA: polyhydroxyalkanoate synthesis regulator DNA-binding domain-containing protein [Candidatus Dormibacteraeota bacterium]|jgi:polyhydroxyalkanoate synthesis repressor PhaR